MPDAGAIDAVPPDAPVSCAPPAFTAGVSTLAGCAEAGRADGARGVARFANPVNVALGPDGDLYVADFDNGLVRAVSSDGTTRTVVEQADFRRPFGLVFDGDTLYVSTDDNDTGGHSYETGTVWRVNLTTGVAEVIARDLGRPRGLAVLPGGDLVLSDYQHHDLRILDTATGEVAPLSGARGVPGFFDGTGTTSRFQYPYGIAIMLDGRIAVADWGNHRIRAVSPTDGSATTLAGTGAEGAVDGAALTTATFSLPDDVAIDDSGAIFVADTGNYLVRRLAGGEVSTVVGDGTGGWLDSDDLRAAEVYGLEGIAITADGGTLWMADGNRGDDTLPYNRVRVADLVP